MTDRTTLRNSGPFTLEEVALRSNGAIVAVSYVVKDSRSAVLTTTHEVLADAEREFSRRVAAG